MKKWFLALALSLTLALPSCHKVNKPGVVEQKTAIEMQHSTTHRIVVYELLYGKTLDTAKGHCSGTAVGPHAILTAQHCFADSAQIRFDANKVSNHILAALVDGNDHVIYIVDTTFTSWAGVNEAEMAVNEPVHMWGNPGNSRDVYRSGYFVRYGTDITLDSDETFQFQFFILPAFRGDSGSGIFDERGSLVAVVSLVNENAESINYPLAFTQQQLDVVTTP